MHPKHETCVSGRTICKVAIEILGRFWSPSLHALMHFYFKNIFTSSLKVFIDL